MRIFPYVTVRRWRIPALMTAVLVMAWLISARPGFWWMQPVLWLAQFEIFHILMHWAIFATLAYLVVTRDSFSPRTRRIWAWAGVMTGGLALEMSQVAGAGESLRALLRWGVAFDLVMDAFGGWIGLRWATLTTRRSIRRKKGGRVYVRAHQ
jgi:hypothetical protein